MNPNIPRPEHPRPDRQRALWRSLNGEWRFAFDERGVGERERWYDGGQFPLRITVPFCYQSALSGIGDTRHCDVVWYAREITVPEEFAGKRTLLHIGAVDYAAKVWLSGQYLGVHEGGYTPFSFDITDLTTPGGTYTVTVEAEDRLAHDRPRGKQSFRPEPFACWYTPCSGIWQTVWLEAVGPYYPASLRLTPDIENACVHVEAELNDAPGDCALRLTVSFDGKPVARQTVSATQRHVRQSVYLAHDETIEGFRYWRPGDPNLYDLTVETLVSGATVDEVQTYFGMRKIACAGGRVLLNHAAVYQRLVLDQGYWQDGLLTAPTDEALRRDVELTLAMGYNGARKHQKFEDPRYLYWADKLGLLVWEELPSAYQLTTAQKVNLLRDMQEAVARDYSHPCIVAWTPLNESWGVYAIRENKETQALADALYALLRALDGTRPISGNDGWEQACTDLVTIHDYTAFGAQLSPEYASASTAREGAPNRARMTQAEGYSHAGKPMLLTEYGGIAMQRDASDGNWGYNGAVNDEKAFLARFADITAAFQGIPYLCGYCYTQLTDVFQEVNGLLDMARKPKASLDEIRKINLR